MVRNKHNTPGIIKYPFWQMTAENPKATYACINDGEAAEPKESEHQAVYINGNIGEILYAACTGFVLMWSGLR